VLASLLGAVVSTHMTSRTAAATATIIFGVAGELGWEVMEYTGQALGFRGMALSEDDTVGDIGAALIGTAFAAAVTWTRWRPSREEPLADWGEIRSEGRAETRAGPAPGADPPYPRPPAPLHGSADGRPAQHRGS
jgi:hypothetical protein